MMSWLRKTWVSWGLDQFVTYLCFHPVAHLYVCAGIPFRLVGAYGSSNLIGDERVSLARIGGNRVLSGCHSWNSSKISIALVLATKEAFWMLVSGGARNNNAHHSPVMLVLCCCKHFLGFTWLIVYLSLSSYFSCWVSIKKFC